MLKRCFAHGLDDMAHVQYFIQGLRCNTWMILNALVGGTVMDKDEMEFK